MIGSRKLLIVAMIAAVNILPVTAVTEAAAQEHIVYSVFKGLNMGNPGEVAQRDYYLSMGSNDGLRVGSTVEVLRKLASYNLMSQKLYKDLIFPIAKLKVIHVEGNAAIARLDKMLPADKTPVITPPAVLIGDQVKLSN